MKATAITDIGKTRAVNQDYIYTSVDRVGCLPNLFIVADGMGGHKAGDIASRFTVETIKTLIEQSQGKDAISIINDSVKMVNGLLLQKASESEDYYGMGTTLVIATIFDNVLRVANVGDSRLYVIDDNDITQITRDHSLVEEMVLAGQLSKSEARTHARKNVITRAIGVEEQVEPEMFSIDLKENSKVLMCSDGLTNMLEDAEILSIVRNNADIEDAARMLIDREAIFIFAELPYNSCITLGINAASYKVNMIGHFIKAEINLRFFEQIREAVPTLSRRL